MSPVKNQEFVPLLGQTPASVEISEGTLIICNNTLVKYKKGSPAGIEHFENLIPQCLRGASN